MISYNAFRGPINFKKMNERRSSAPWFPKALALQVQHGTVDGLIFRVRDGYGSFPAAMAATSSQGPDLNRSIAALQAAA